MGHIFFRDKGIRLSLYLYHSGRNILLNREKRLSSITFIIENQVTLSKIAYPYCELFIVNCLLNCL